MTADRLSSLLISHVDRVISLVPRGLSPAGVFTQWVLIDRSDRVEQVYVDRKTAERELKFRLACFPDHDMTVERVVVLA